MDPVAEASLQLPGLQLREDASEGVVQGDAVRQLPERNCSIQGGH